MHCLWLLILETEWLHQISAGLSVSMPKLDVFVKCVIVTKLNLLLNGKIKFLFFIVTR